MSIIKYFYLFVLLTTNICTQAWPSESRTLHHDGLDRHYWLHVPAGDAPASGRALVVGLHPSFSNAQNFRTTATAGSWEQQADQHNFIVAFPDGTDRGATWPDDQTLQWNSYTFDGSGVDDLGFLRKLIDDIATRHQIDKERIYLTGFSNGAMMANTFAIMHGRLVAAIGPVSGGWMNAYAGDAVAATISATAPVPCWIWRGSEEDDIVTGSPGNQRSRAEQDVAQRDWWLQQNAITNDPVMTSEGDQRTWTYGGGRDHSELRYTEVANASHRWHSGASAALWQFFNNHKRDLNRPQASWVVALSSAVQASIRGTCMLPDGDVVVCGSWQGEASFAGETLIAVDGSDAFVARLSGEDGQLRWLQRLQGPGNEWLLDVSYHDSTGIVTAGSFTDRIHLSTSTHNSAGAADLIVCSWTTDGVLQWHRREGGSGNEWASEVSCTDNAIALVGSFDAATSIGNAQLGHAGADDLLLACYLADGSPAWAKALGSTGSDQGRGVTWASNGSCWICGQLGGAVTHGQTELQVLGGTDIVIANFASNGEAGPGMAFGGSEDDVARGIGSDATGNIVVSGLFRQSMSIGSRHLQSQGSSDAFAIGLDSSLQLRWLDRFGGTGTEQGYEVQVAADGRAWLYGSHAAHARFGSFIDQSQGMRDGSLLLMDQWGSVRWLAAHRSAGDDIAYDLASSASGDRLALVGHYGSGVQFDSITVPSTTVQAAVSYYRSEVTAPTGLTIIAVE